ncbi:MAG TPA: CoA pyrophosphatase [Longimicrobiaceae bacterium]|nr:CoA pyrophosphatase [Longimicrobiaceae bacterium]
MHHRSITALRRALAARAAQVHPPHTPAPRAAVALLLRPAGDDLELLLIRRADRAGDPWSGHMALPGGRAEPADADSRATAARETREEVGIDVEAGGEWLGALDELYPRSGAPSIVVAPHVFAVPASTEAVPNHEVAEALWIPLAELAHPEAATEYVYRMEGGGSRSFPAYGARGNVVWGLTYRMLSQFLELHAALDAEDAR